MPDATSEPVIISTYAEAREVYRQRDLRQALYDAGEVVMADVLVNLHGSEHRDRRRLENRLFRRDVHERYERELFPPIIEETLAPHRAAGRVELVRLGHQLMMNLAAFSSGVDRPLGTPEETFRLYDYLMRFIEGATLAHYTGDREAKAAEIRAKQAAFDAEFLRPSIERRQALLAAAEPLPLDVLSVLLSHRDELALTDEVVLREVAFYLLAGAHTSATAFTRATHHLFGWLREHPDDRTRLVDDLGFVRRCVQETVRLQPSSPVGMRWALAEITLRSGRTIHEGDKVVIDLLAVNRDPEVFGDDAERFDPTRVLPDGVAPHGLSFGSGMHACIGQELAIGVDGVTDGPDPLVGLVPVAVQALFASNARPDPDDPPELDESTTRPYFARYPIQLGPPLA